MSDQRIIAIDLTVFLAANLYNLVLVAVFLVRTRNAKRLERRIGFLGVLLGIPFLIASILNAIAGREWWVVVLVLPTAMHCLIELFVDYVTPSNFRYTRWLWPYLALFYLGQWLLVGYSFLISDTFGAITLATYFLCLGATMYSYRKVVHGERRI